RARNFAARRSRRPLLTRSAARCAAPSLDHRAAPRMRRSPSIATTNPRTETTVAPPWKTRPTTTLSTSTRATQHAAAAAARRVAAYKVPRALGYSIQRRRSTDLRLRLIDHDPAGSLVGEARPRPVDDRPGAIFPRREEREMDGTPREPGGRALDRPAPGQLHDGCLSADRSHRAFVAVLERLGLLTTHAARDVLPRLLPRLERH